MKAPEKCPICGASEEWKLIDTTKKGFSAKNAIIGGVLLGGFGLVAGASGKKKSLYQCLKCGFSHEYDGEADKEKPINQAREQFTNEGNITVWINSIKKATPICQFCGQPQELKIKYTPVGYQFKCDYCKAIFQCSFTIGGKIKNDSTVILNCGEANINSLPTGKCDANILIKDETAIKYKK